MIDYELIREKTKLKLAERGWPMHPHLPSVDGLLRRTPLEIAKRMVGLFAMLGLARGADPDLLWNWMEENSYLDFLSQVEMNILQKDEFSECDLNVCSWKQESLFVLCWFAGFESEIAVPTEESDLTNAFPLLPPEVSISDLVKSFELRSQHELIEELDFYYCLNAAIRHKELWDNISYLEAIKFAAVEERRRTFEWLVSKNGDWDEISLDT